MADLGELAGRRTADALGRRRRRDERRERLLERDELAEQRVVVGVGELGRILLVVQAVGPLDVLGELRVAGSRLILGQVGSGLDQARVDGQIGRHAGG